MFFLPGFCWFAPCLFVSLLVYLFLIKLSNLFWFYVFGLTNSERVDVGAFYGPLLVTIVLVANTCASIGLFQLFPSSGDSKSL